MHFRGDELHKTKICLSFLTIFFGLFVCLFIFNVISLQIFWKPKEHEKKTNKIALIKWIFAKILQKKKRWGWKNANDKVTKCECVWLLATFVQQITHANDYKLSFWTKNEYMIMWNKRERRNTQKQKETFSLLAECLLNNFSSFPFSYSFLLFHRSYSFLTECIA